MMSDMPGKLPGMFTTAKRRLVGVAVALSLIGAAAAPASADITRSGSTFTAAPALCSCWSTIDGYQFVGIPYSPFVRDVFLGLPADTPVATDIWSELQANPAYVPLPPVTSGSVDTTVSGSVGDEDPPVDDGDDGRSSWGRGG